MQLEAYSQITGTGQHRVAYKSLRCSRRADRDGWENTSFCIQERSSQGSCHKYFHCKTLTSVFLHPSGWVSPQNALKKWHFHEKSKEFRLRVLYFKSIFHIRIGLLSLGKRTPFCREKLTNQASVCGREKRKRPVFKFKTPHKSKVMFPAVLLGLGYIQFQQCYTYQTLK